MSIFKYIISFLLLFSILIGIVHNIFPHCQDLELINSTTGEESNHHHHEHHEYDSNLAQVTELDHVKHDNHFDKDYFDLLVCIFYDIELSDDNCDLVCFVFWNQRVGQTSKANLHFIISILRTTFSNIVFTKTIQNYSIHTNSVYTSPSIEHSPLRGPPKFSC